MRPERHERSSSLGGWLTAAVAVIALLAAVGLALLRQSVHRSVDEAAAVAQESHPGDPVEALIHRATSEDVPLRSRTRAVWVLGELRDDRAEPHLERLHVQDACDHDRLVCQREVRLALAKIRGELSPAYTLRQAWSRLRRRLGVPGAGAVRASAAREPPARFGAPEP